MKLLKKKLFCRTGKGREANIFWKEGTGVGVDYYEIIKKKLFCRTGEGREANIFWKEGTGVGVDYYEIIKKKTILQNWGRS